MNSESGVQPQNDPSIVALEWALIAHPSVAEAAAMASAPGSESTAGNGPLRVFVVLQEGAAADDAQRASLAGYVAQHLGDTAPAMEIVFVEALPKTRTGKVARWMLGEQS